MDPATGTVKSCAAARCADCKSNYLTCVRCDSLDSWHPSTDLSACTCLHLWLNVPDQALLTPSCLISRAGGTALVGGSWNPTDKVLRLDFGFEPVFHPSLAVFLATAKVTDKTTGESLSLQELQAEVVDRSDKGFGLRLNTRRTVLSAELVIDRSAGVVVFKKGTELGLADYPVRVAGIYSVPQTDLLAAGTAIAEAVSNSRTLVTVLMVKSSPTASIILDYMFSELFLLKQYEGEFLVYPEIILRTTAQSSLLPFEVPNIFETEDDGSCIPSSVSLQQSELSCIALNNFGGPHSLHFDPGRGCPGQ